MKSRLSFVAILVAFSTAWSAPADEVGTFPQLCRQFLGQKGLKTGLQADICNQIEHENFSGTEAIQDISPTKLEMNADEVDKRIRYVTFYRAGHLPRLVYCFAVFKKWINTKQVDPAVLPLLSTGLSISRDDMVGYPQWLTGPEGTACNALVQKRLGSPLIDIAAEMKDRDLLIAVNPLGAMKNVVTPPQVKKELQNTIAHARIEALHVTCPSFAAWADKRWAQLSKPERSKLMTSYPEYNWSDATVGSRESVAYAYESKPIDLARYRADCKY